MVGEGYDAARIRDSTDCEIKTVSERLIFFKRIAKAQLKEGQKKSQLQNGIEALQVAVDGSV